MAVKFASAFRAEVTMLNGSPSKEADTKRLGAHHFALTSDPAVMKKLPNDSTSLSIQSLHPTIKVFI
jgi:alcohol dehydrogenase (NADP+)